MRPRESFVRLLLATSLYLATSAPASALVTISHTSPFDGMDLDPGATFTVDVNVSWDGSGSLAGIFASTGFDDSVVRFETVDFLGLGETASSVFNVFPPPVFISGLRRLGGISFAGDPGNLIRTVQYGLPHPATAPAGGAGTEFVTRITFAVIGPGITTIGTVFGASDVGAVGDTFDGGDPVTIIVAGMIPEPSTTVLVGLGLAALAASRRR